VAVVRALPAVGVVTFEAKLMHACYNTVMVVNLKVACKERVRWDVERSEWHFPNCTRYSTS
jgi:hypothetical protein